MKQQPRWQTNQRERSSAADVRRSHRAAAALMGSHVTRDVEPPRAPLPPPSWIADVVFQPGYVPPVDLHGYTDSGWEWCIISRAQGGFDAICAIIGKQSRSLVCDSVDEAAAWLEDQTWCVPVLKPRMRPV